MDIEDIGEREYYNQWILKTLVKVSTTTNGYWRHWWRLVLQPMDIEHISEG